MNIYAFLQIEQFIHSLSISTKIFNSSILSSNDFEQAVKVEYVEKAGKRPRQGK